MCFNWLKLWIQLELVRGIAVMASEFLVSAMETTERQGESRTQKDKERMWSCGEGKDGSVVTFAIVVRSLQPAGYRQKPSLQAMWKAMDFSHSPFAALV